MSLSVCMIVRNEAHQVGTILNQCKTFADEIIVLDTGSTDRTIPIAKRFTPNVYNDFEWCDDFSAARNYCMKRATSDYILTVDADDRIDIKSQEKIFHLKNLLSNKEMKAFLFKIYNPDEHDIVHLFYQVRMFPNIPEIYYVGRAHNEVESSIRNANIPIYQAKIIINHMGFADKEILDKKRERTLAILEKEYQEKPDDERVNSYLGMLYQKKGMNEQALFHMEKAIPKFNNEFDNRPFGLYQALPTACRAAAALGNMPKARWYWIQFAKFVSSIPNLAMEVTELGEELGFNDDLCGTN